MGTAAVEPENASVALSDKLIAAFGTSHQSGLSATPAAFRTEKSVVEAPANWKTGVGVADGIWLGVKLALAWAAARAGTDTNNAIPNNA